MNHYLDIVFDNDVTEELVNPDFFYEVYTECNNTYKSMLIDAARKCIERGIEFTFYEAGKDANVFYYSVDYKKDLSDYKGIFQEGTPVSIMAYHLCPDKPVVKGVVGGEDISRDYFQ